MATLAIGDVHGNLSALQSLLQVVLTELGSRDTLVFLGDYIDRGPNSKNCVEEIIRLSQDTQYSVVTLLGNHEEWMLATMHDYTRHSWLLGADAFETVRSYSPSAASLLRQEVDRAGPRLIMDEVELPYDAFFDVMPASHKRFFEELQLFHRADDTLFVHAGIDPDGGPPEEQDSRELTWGLCHDFPDGYRGLNKVVYGHHDNGVVDDKGWPRPFILNELTYGIDTIRTGVLTAIRMPDGKVFQSDRFRGPPDMV